MIREILEEIKKVRDDLVHTNNPHFQSLQNIILKWETKLATEEKEPSLSEVLRQGFEEEQAQRKKEEEEEEDEEEDTKKFLDDIANNTPNMTMFDDVEGIKDEVIDIDNYERYWDNSTPNGHQIRILKQDNSTLTINLEWPKGKNPRLREVKKR